MSDLSKLNDKQSLLLTQLSYYSDKAKSLKFYCDKRVEDTKGVNLLSLAHICIL